MHKELLQRVSLYIKKMRAPRLLRGAEGFTHRTNDPTGPLLRRCDPMSREALSEGIAHPATARIDNVSIDENTAIPPKAVIENEQDVWTCGIGVEDVPPGPAAVRRPA